MVELKAQGCDWMSRKLTSSRLQRPKTGYLHCPTFQTSCVTNGVLIISVTRQLKNNRQRQRLDANGLRPTEPTKDSRAEQIRRVNELDAWFIYRRALHAMPH